MAWVATVFSFACGVILDVGIRRYAGKGQSELGMLRLLWDVLRPGDVVLADRLMCAWTEMIRLKQRGIDSATPCASAGPTPGAAGVWGKAITSSGGSSRGSRARSTRRPPTRCPSP